jgi:hypothetical protein
MNALRGCAVALAALAAVASCGVVVVSAMLSTSCSAGTVSAGAEGGDGSDGDAGDGGAEGGPVIVPCVAPAPQTCQAATTVADSQAVFALIRALDEARDVAVSPSSGLALRPTVGIRSASPLDLDIAVLRQLRPACPAPTGDAGTGRPSCTESVFAPEKPFHGGGGIAKYPEGVECIATSAEGCEKVNVAAGATVRFQRVVEANAFAAIEKHVVRVVRDCAVACAASEVFCEASRTCVAAGPSACLLCDGQPATRCACSAACGTSVEGAMCSYETSDDTGSGGMCRGGGCVGER